MSPKTWQKIVGFRPSWTMGVLEDEWRFANLAIFPTSMIFWGQRVCHAKGGKKNVLLLLFFVAFNKSM